MQLVPAEVENFDDRCIRLIELFGAHLVLEELQSRCMELHGACEGCRANAWSCMALVKVAGRMHGVACRMQRQSFLVEREC